MIIKITVIVLENVRLPLLCLFTTKQLLVCFNINYFVINVLLLCMCNIFDVSDEISQSVLVKDNLIIAPISVESVRGAGIYFPSDLSDIHNANFQHFKYVRCRKQEIYPYSIFFI